MNHKLYYYNDFDNFEKEIDKRRNKLTAVEETIWKQTENLAMVTNNEFNDFYNIFYSKSHDGYYGAQLGDNGLELFKVDEPDPLYYSVSVSLEEYLTVLNDTQKEVSDFIKHKFLSSNLSKEDEEILNKVFRIVNKFPQSAYIDYE